MVKLAESAAERAVLAILRKFQASREGGLRKPPRTVVPNRQFRGRSPDALTSEVLVQPLDVNMDNEIKSEGGRGRGERGGNFDVCTISEFYAVIPVCSLLLPGEARPLRRQDPPVLLQPVHWHLPPVRLGQVQEGQQQL